MARVITVPDIQVKSANTVGAGDAFSAAFLHGLEQGWPPEQIGDFANRIALHRPQKVDQIFPLLIA